MGYNRALTSKASKNTNFRKNAVTNLIKLIDYEEFKCRSKVGLPGVFTRNRNITFKDLLIMISRGIKNSLQRELDLFYKEVTDSDYSIRKVTKGAFTQARAKLGHTAFIEMNDNVNNTFYDEAPYYLWNGFRLIAVDGTRLVLPDHESIKQEFGEHEFGPNADSKKSLGLASIMYDVLNLMTIDAQLAPYSENEQNLLRKHLEKIKKDDFLLLDRFYPSIELIFLLNAMGINFCMRMKESWWKSVRELVNSDKKEMNVLFDLPEKSKWILEKYPRFKQKQVSCRLVLVELENGEKEVLCTSLINRKKYPRSIFKELYHYRWNIEEGYKLFKARAEVESFSGKTALSVKQDFYAKIFSMSLCAVLSFPIEEKVRKESKQNKHKHEKKINRTSALAMVKNISIGLFLKKEYEKAINAFDTIVEKTTEIIRPGRKFVRKKKPKKLYYMNYKPF